MESSSMGDPPPAAGPLDLITAPVSIPALVTDLVAPVVLTTTQSQVLVKESVAKTPCTIASGVGIPVHSEFAKLPPYSTGEVKLKVVVELERHHSGSVIVKDSVGNSVLVSAEYLKLPPHCGTCKDFGHLDLRCPSRVECGPAARLAPASRELVVEVSPDSHASAHVRSTTLPSLAEVEDMTSSSGAWLPVVKRSKHRPQATASSSSLSKHVTAAQFEEENSLINEAQSIMRRRIAEEVVVAPSFVVASSRKKARRKQRQKLLLLSLSESDPGSIPQVPPLEKPLAVSFTSVSVSSGQLPPPIVPISTA
ncbi:hypothetical protein AALP_AA4G071200 [Arabis alpina]|uniref:DUF4283 domain-containing protein n=1 Tax=Arabis alpina TaxID=50452 RepID=A0A087H1P7_ARAAL|nr:hypothetical protein AALP_AA4G071200 [Arabis alpina]